MAAKKAKSSINSSGDEMFIQDVLSRREEIAAELRQSVSRSQANEALAGIFRADEATQLGLLKTLAKQQEVDAADILLAINELAPQKDVRKEARRALIQLAGNKIYPSWAPGSEQPTAIANSYPPRFWKGLITEMREEGQAQLTLCWEQGFEYEEARVMFFLLDFWQYGIKEFFTETGTKRHIDGHVREQVNLFEKERKEAQHERIQMTDCTLAEGKRLILEAMDVNAWRKTTPYKDFRHAMPTINQLILNAPEMDVDRGKTFINPNLEPDDVVGNFIGAWSLGDYGLCYDLLSADSSLREGLDRDEWLDRRRDWSDEAHPQYLELQVAREREQSQSAIWLPGSFTQARAATRREIDACWSLELAESPLSGTLPEMPFGTAVLRETGRRWFWTSYVLVQEDGMWRIQRIDDEGANLQGLPLAELEKRVKEHKDALSKIVDETNDLRDATQEQLDEVVWRSIYALHEMDALIVKNPLDVTSYGDAVGACLGIGLRERSLVYLRMWKERFPQDPQYINLLRQLASIETLLASNFQIVRRKQRADLFFELAEQDLTEALERDRSATSLMLMGEAKLAQQDLDESVDYLQQALDSDPTPDDVAQIENDLASISLDRNQPEEALRHFQRVEALEPDYTHLTFNIGHTYRILNNFPEAEAYLARAVEEEVDKRNAIIELSTLYASQGDLVKSAQLAERGVRLYPDSPTLHALFSGILLDQGNTRRAEAELQAAEQIDPDLAIVKTMRQMFDEARRR
jgi:tetratricopeptide (TPR) repeat protein